MTVATTFSSAERARLRADWNNMRSEFHKLVESIPQASFRQRTIDTCWSIAEILTHMIQSIDFIHRKSKRSEKARIS